MKEISTKERKLLGYLFRFARTNSKLTQKTLSKKIGISQETISSLELGKYNSKKESYFRLANFFKINIDEFLGLSELKQTHVIEKPEEECQVPISLDKYSMNLTAKISLNFIGGIFNAVCILLLL